MMQSNISIIIYLESPDICKVCTLFSLLCFYSSFVFSFAACLFVSWMLIFGFCLFNFMLLKHTFCYLPTCVLCVWDTFSFKCDTYSSKWSHVYLWPQTAVAQELERVIQLFGRPLCCFKSPAPLAACRGILEKDPAASVIIVWMCVCEKVNVKCCKGLWAVSILEKCFRIARPLTTPHQKLLCHCLLLISLRPSPFIKKKYWQLTFL